MTHVKRFMKKVLKAEDIYLDELSFSFIWLFRSNHATHFGAKGATHFGAKGATFHGSNMS